MSAQVFSVYVNIYLYCSSGQLSHFTYVYQLICIYPNKLSYYHILADLDIELPDLTSHIIITFKQG